MNTKIKKLWVKALLSGRFNPGTGALCTVSDTKDYCCLGVLCELAARRGIVKRKEVNAANIGRCISFAGNTATGYLPVKVMKWAGIKENDPTVNGDFGDGEEQITLSQLNDDRRASQSDIANAIQVSL